MFVYVSPLIVYLIVFMAPAWLSLHVHVHTHVHVCLLFSLIHHSLYAMEWLAQGRTIKTLSKKIFCLGVCVISYAVRHSIVYMGRFYFIVFMHMFGWMVHVSVHVMTSLSGNTHVRGGGFVCENTPT